MSHNHVNCRNTSTITVAAIGTTRHNRIWKDITLGIKNRLYPDYQPGGFPWEATRQARALGLHVSVITMLGDDPAGDFLYDAYNSSGADIRGIRRMSSLTPTADVLLRRDVPDERTVLMDQSTDTASLTLRQVDRELVAAADLVVAGGTLDRFGSDSVLTDVIHLARQENKPLFLNPTRIHNVQTIDLRGVKLIMVGRDDFLHYGFAMDTPAVVVADTLLGRGAENVAITDSANPMHGFNHKENVIMLAVPIPQELVKYPTGCGEAAFLAAVGSFISGARMYAYLNVAAVAGAWFIMKGAPASWSDLDDLNQQYLPKDRLTLPKQRNGQALPNPKNKTS